MRTILSALLLAVAGTAFAQPASTIDETRLDALVALARVHGVVRYFHPSDSLDQVDWNRFLAHAAARMGEVIDRKEIAPRLEELFAPAVEGFRVAPAGSAATAPGGEGPVVEWRHLGYGLEDPKSLFVSWRTHHRPLLGKGASPGFFQNAGRAEASVDEEPVARVAIAGGLEAQVPISMPMSATKVGEAQAARLQRLAATIAPAAPAGDGATRAQAHADGIALWNVARHFYPYWPVVKLDWEEALRQWLAAQPEVQSRAQLRDALARLAAPLDDGQARVLNAGDMSERAYLPLAIRPVGSRWVVDESRVEGIRVGDELVAVDGVPVAAWYARRAAQESGSARFKRWRVRGAFLQGPKEAKVRLRLARGAQVLDAAIAYDSPQPIGAPRRPQYEEVRPGIYYVDLGRVQMPEFDRMLPALREARGIVFDLRANPSADARQLVRYWIRDTDGAQWMNIPRFDAPFKAPASGWSFGWQEGRDGALDKPAKVLLADGRSIGHAESLAAYFPAQKAGAVVGEATAGANGNLAAATLPSGMRFVFTAMVVTRHDGSVLHVEGVRPDIEVVPTPQGIRAGRDEVLERALQGIEAAAKR